MRFIPVCTGNTFLGSNQTLKSPVYPSVYREHGAYVGAHGLNSGLSLCVQGTPIQNWYSIINIRFIPVCTGNIILVLLFFHCRQVYPCVYREHTPIWCLILFLIGLSLCVQGTSHAGTEPANSIRFIPVCTGNILLECATNPWLTVYPCVYREHTNYNILFYN